MSRYIGISLNDDYTEVCVDGEDYQRTFPTVICRQKNEDRFLVGEAAYRAGLDGSGVIADKLLSLLRKDGTATMNRVTYTAKELMQAFLSEIIRIAEEDTRENASEATTENSPETEPTDESGEESRGVLEILPAESLGNDGSPESAAETGPEDSVPKEAEKHEAVLVLSLRKPEKKLFSVLKDILQEIRGEARCEVISHTESFVHYILRQDKNLYNRLVGMFELSNQCLYYYEMQVSRGSRRYVLAGSEAQEEAFNLDILKTASGGKIADRILMNLADRNLKKKSFSAIFLTGKGFEKLDFAQGFLQFIHKGRRLCQESRVFAIGAMAYGGLLYRGEQEEYTVLSDTSVHCDVSVRVAVREKEQKLPVVRAGDSWLNPVPSYEMILDQQDYVDFELRPMMGGQKQKELRMRLQDFPERENRTTRIRLSADFTDSDHMQISVEDRGFGELFPATGVTCTEEIDLKRVMEE